MRGIYKIGGIGIIAGVLFVSCKVGKEYVRPELNLPAAIEAGNKADTVSVSELKWWDLYTDTVLQGLIREALVYNKDMQLAITRIKSTEASKRIAKADIFPKVDMKISGQRDYDYTPENIYETKGLLSWEVDLWGRLRWGSQAAVAEYLQTVEGQRALQMTIIAQVAQAYYELCALDEELKIVRQTLAAREEGVHLAKLRYEGGLTSETSLRQAQVELAKAATLVPDLERKIKLQENDICLLTGRYPGSIRRGEGLRRQKLPRMLPVGLPSELLERRPDIRGAVYRLKAATAKAGMAYTNMFPKLTLSAQYGLESNQWTEFFKSPFFFLGGQLTGPLFNLGKNRAQYKAAKAVAEGEGYAYQKAVLTAFKEVNNALVSCRKIEEIRQARMNLEEAARSYLDLANLQYINGVIGYLDVLDAQRGFFDAQIGLNNAVRDELIAVVNLYKVLGGGWEADTHY